MTDSSSPHGADPSRSAPPRRALLSGEWPAPVTTASVHAVVRVPGSKSETNRALVLAALADGPCTIVGGLEARDTRKMRDALRALGVRIDDEQPEWQVVPPTGGLGAEGTGDLEMDCGQAGTVMRFLPGVAALTPRTTRFVGDEDAQHRPVGPLLDALYDMGAEVEPGATTLPFTITGRSDLPGGTVLVDASGSSQYISGLLLIGARCAEGLEVRHTGKTLPSLPNIEMTVQMLADRGVRVEQPEPHRWVVAAGPISGGRIVVQPDLSGAAPFAAAAVLTRGEVTIPDWPHSTNQPGGMLPEILQAFGAETELDENGLTVRRHGPLRGADLDLSAASELTPVIAAMAAVAPEESRIRGVAHIRGHETDRLAALESGLNALGSATHQTEDGLVIEPRILHGGMWRTHADHRMAHAGALLGLLVDDLTVDDIGCVAKTMPEFAWLWEQMLVETDEWAEAQH